MGLTPIEIQAISETTAALVVQALIKAQEAKLNSMSAWQIETAELAYLQALKDELKHLSQ